MYLYKVVYGRGLDGAVLEAYIVADNFAAVEEVFEEYWEGYSIESIYFVSENVYIQEDAKDDGSETTP